MSELEQIEFNNRIINGLQLAEYQTLRKKALLNELVIQTDNTGNVVRRPARDIFEELYNEPIDPTYNKQ